jgi:hypothetical protein
MIEVGHVGDLLKLLRQPSIGPGERKSGYA